MAKTNFTKSEIALAEALERMKVEELLVKADAASGKENKSIPKERAQIIRSLQYELNFIHRHDREIYKKLKVKRKDLERILDNITTLNDEEWNNLLAFKTQINAYVKQLSQAESNEEIVKNQRHRHINKRFNVSDKWLPLK